MRCEQLQFDLPLYIDDVLDEDVKAAIESHLPTCPLCRQKLSDFGEIRNGLLQVGVPAMPAKLLEDLREPYAGPAARFDLVILGGRTGGIREILNHWLLPLSTGTVLSAIVSVLFLSVLLIQPAARILEDEQQSRTETASAPVHGPYSQEDLTVGIPDRSPEVNPTGALMALTKSIVRGKMSDEEVVVVADVFGNGLANIAEIVDPPKDDRAMRELEKAFAATPENAPFLPSKVRKDTDAVRVVLKIQRVDVKR